MSTVTLLPFTRLSLVRSFSTSMVNHKEPYSTVDRIIRNKDIYKIYPHKVMYKLLFKDKKNNPFFIHNYLGAPSIDVKTAVDVVAPRRIADTKRVRVLNKLFMRYIPEILSTSDIGSDLAGHDVQISRIRMNQNFHLIDVYWVPTGMEDEKIQKMLDNVAYPLRSELIKLRVMGLVPEIRFRKEPYHAMMLEVDRRLRIADFGEDYVPTNVFAELNLKKELQLQIQLPEEIRRKISSLESSEKFSAEEEREIPPMEMNVFGLYYNKIMDSIKDGVKRTKAVDRVPPPTAESLIGMSAIKEVPFNFEAQRRENWSKSAFLSYLKKKKIERKKIVKLANKQFYENLAQVNLSSGDTEQPEDEFYNEFVENAFADELTGFDNEELSDRYESEQ